MFTPASMRASIVPFYTDAAHPCGTSPPFRAQTAAEQASFPPLPPAANGVANSAVLNSEIEALVPADVLVAPRARFRQWQAINSGRLTVPQRRHLATVRRRLLSRVYCRRQRLKARARTAACKA